jgi:hypothetical protein
MSQQKIDLFHRKYTLNVKNSIFPQIGYFLLSVAALFMSDKANKSIQVNINIVTTLAAFDAE